MTRTTTLALAALLITAAPLTVPAGQETVVHGVVHVRNGAEPAEGRQMLRLTERWRRGGEDDDLFFGLVIQTRFDDAGRVYLLDMQLAQVTVLGADGEVVGALSREGDGPGETRRPSDLVLLDGGGVGIVQGYPGRLVRLDAEGHPVGTLEVGGDPLHGGATTLELARYRDGHLVAGLIDVHQPEPGTQRRTSRIVRLDDTGAREVVYHEAGFTWDFRDFHFSEHEHIEWAARRMALGPDGRVYSATERDTYAITVFAPDGTVERVIEREYEPYRRSDREYDAVHALYASMLRQLPFEVEMTIADTEPAIGWIGPTLRVSDDGALWVLSSRGQRPATDGIMAVYDVFDADGRFRRQVAVVCEADGTEDALFLDGGGERAVVVKGFMAAARAMFGAEVDTGAEPAPIEVIGYGVEAVD
ncbi:hypothetical protein GF314_07780 [bacterium]|nr:hypothetical protein [bacterium]